MARLDLSLLGGFQVSLDGEPVNAFESDKVRALLAFLAVECERPHRRERLAGLLWPERTERNARQNLSQALFNLRQAIGDRMADPPFLQITQQTLQFNSVSDVWIDVAAFSERLAAATPFRSTGTPAEPQVIQDLEEAMRLRRGGFLQGFSLPDSPAFEEWLLHQRESCLHLTLRALQRLAVYYEERGECERALPHAQRAVQLDPWWEEAQRGLMRLLALSGQRAQALAQYELYRCALVEELGLEPEAETMALYERIKAGATSPGPQGVPRAPPHNLPASLTAFVGRQAELAEIKERLQDPVCRLLTVVGPGGIGKTRLALQAVRELLGSSVGQTLFPQGVFFVPLTSVGGVDALSPTIAGALGLSLYRETKPIPGRLVEVDAKAQLLSYLRKKAVLLLLDNFEHLLEGVHLVIELLRAAPALKVLVTSREPLDVRGEWRYPVAGLAFPPEDRVGAQGARPDLESYDAVALWVQSARRVCPAFSLTHDQRPVMRICQLVEGMPLAIELAASWLKILPPIQIAAEMEQGLDILTTSWRDVAPRHRSMRAVFDHSWRLLSVAEAAVLRRLGVFVGSFGLRAAQAVAGASLPMLSGLAERSLLHVTPAGRHYMHELFRQYALERLQENRQEEEQTRDRYSAYYTRFLQAQAAALKGCGQQAALAELDTQIENARAAWNWAAERGQVARLDDGLDGLCLYYLWRLRAAEGEAACRLAAETLGRVRIADALRVLARVLAWHGVFSAELGRAELADPLLARSLSLLDSPALAGRETRAERAFVLGQMGAQAFGDWERGRMLHEGSLALYRELGDEWWTADALSSLGWLRVYVGKYDEAICFFRECLALCERLGDPRGIADALRSLGTAAAVVGEREECERLLRGSLAIWRKLEDRAGIAGGLNQLAVMLVFWARFDEGRAMFEESLAICRDLGLRYRTAWAETWLGFGELHQGHYQHARAQGQASLALGRELGDLPTIGRAFWILGDGALAEGANAEAQGFLEESVAVYQGFGLPNELVVVLADLGATALMQHQLGQAQQHLCQGLQTAIELRMVALYALLLPATALLLAELGQAEQAVEVYALASRHPLVSASRWFDDVIGRRLVAVMADMPPAVVAAAQARGRVRDLEATTMAVADALAQRQQ